MEREKLILVRSIKVLYNELSKLAFTLFSSISVSKKHEFGCRFYVRCEFLKYVKDFKIIKRKNMLFETES